MRTALKMHGALRASLSRSIFFICALLPLGAGAQINLIRNAGFDEHYACPGIHADCCNYAYHWSSLDTIFKFEDVLAGLSTRIPSGVPEYCNMCYFGGGGGAPLNNYAYQYPRSDSGMMMMIMYTDYSDTISDARYYLQQQLARNLAAGKRYQASFYVVSGAMMYSVNNIGAFFDDGSIDTTSYPYRVQLRTPQVEDTSVITDTLNWKLISGTFVANGTERFMTIGNFRSNAATTTIPPVTSYLPWPRQSHYLIDDVSLIECGTLPQGGGNVVLGQGDSVRLGPNERQLPYRWYVQGNPTAIDSGGGTIVRPTTTTTYILEQELCGVKSYDTVKVTVYNVSVAQLYRGHRLRPYPVPATTTLTIDGIAGSTATLIDMVGRQVAEVAATTDKTIIDISTLPPGLYLLQVTDTTTGDRAIEQVEKR